MAEAMDNAKRLQESTDLLQRLLDEEAVPERDRPEIAVQIVYNRDALASANALNERLVAFLSQNYVWLPDVLSDEARALLTDMGKGDGG